jgi:hypothetical protein
MTFPKSNGNKTATVLGMTFTSDSRYIGRHRPKKGRTSALYLVKAYMAPRADSEPQSDEPEVA